MGLTKEEKKAIKEAKRLAKLAEEAEAARQLKRLEMKREMAAQALQKDELDKTWRELMLKIKEPVFKKDMEIMWHTFERSYDKKDCLIKYTMKLMDTADDQFQRTIASFCVTIDTMVNNFLDELNAMDKINITKTKNLLKTGENDATRIMTDHNAAETHLQLLLYHAHTTADSLAWTTRGENLVKQDEDRNKYFHDRENLTSLLEDNYNNIWEEFKAVLKSYITETAQNQKQVRKLRRKENLMADIIDSQGKKIANSDGLLKRLRTELAAYESGTKQAVFRDRRKRHRAACYKLKKRMMNGLATDVNKMDLLVKVSDDSIEWLDKAAKKGEKILRMAALCRKYESRREKVLPYGTYIPHSPVQMQLRQTKSDDSLVLNAISTTSGMTRLWQRISKAELTRRALYNEKILLEQENLYITRKLAAYNENNMEPKTQICVCNDPKHKPARDKPVAVEAVLELSKYKHNM